MLILSYSTCETCETCETRETCENLRNRCCASVPPDHVSVHKNYDRTPPPSPVSTPNSPGPPYLKNPQPSSIHIAHHSSKAGMEILEHQHVRTKCLIAATPFAALLSGSEAMLDDCSTLDGLHHPPLFERSQHVSLFWTCQCSVSAKLGRRPKLPRDGAGARESTRITRVTMLWTLMASESSMVGIRTRETRIR